jgi:hypothetical protein
MSTARQTSDPRLAKRSAEIALSAKQPGEALAAIRLWRELAPNSNEATQYYLGFMVANNLAEIQKVFSKTSKKLTETIRRHHETQRLLARGRDKNAAFDVLEETLRPTKPCRKPIALAQGAYSKGDNKRAVEEAQLVLKPKPIRNWRYSPSHRHPRKKMPPKRWRHF